MRHRGQHLANAAALTVISSACGVLHVVVLRRIGRRHSNLPDSLLEGRVFQNIANVRLVFVGRVWSNTNAVYESVSDDG
jgi:hypothetical protein